MKKWILASIFTLCTTSVFAGEGAAWTYDGDSGPAHWGNLSPAYAACAKGSTQTPINVKTPLSQTKDIATIHYEPLPLDIIDDADTALTINKEKIVVNTGHSIQINNLNDASKEFLTYQGTTYHLVQFHFHTPAESQWNGFQYPMEIHFVNQNDDGKVAVIAVFVAAGGHNATLKTILDNLPEAANKEKIDKSILLNVKNLLPPHETLASFQGSLTTPPCTEGLQWLVYQHPIMAGSLQIQAMQKAIGHTNARPLQPLNKRSVDTTKANAT